MKHIIKFDNFVFEGKEINLNSLTDKKMEKSFPVSDKRIKDIAVKVSKHRSAIVGDLYITSNKYDTFATCQKTISITLNDAGLDSVTASGTYHAKRGIKLQFHIRGHWDKNAHADFSINASYNNPGGMSVFDSRKIYNEKDIEFYMKSILHSIEPNDITNMAY